MFNQTGPRKLNDAISEFIYKIIYSDDGKIVVEEIDKYRDITPISTTCTAFHKIIENGKIGEVYNLCSGISYYIEDILKYIISAIGGNIQIEKMPSEFRFNNPFSIVGNNSKIEKVIGKIDNDLYKTIDEMINSVIYSLHLK